MKEGEANFVLPAELIGHPARSAILLALLDGRALPMSMLASEAGVVPSTASEHLTKLTDGGLLRVRREGRRRYYELASPEVARALEALARLAPPEPVRSLRAGTHARALRLARSCYDHLAGHLGVALMKALLAEGVLVGGAHVADDLHATAAEHVRRADQHRVADVTGDALGRGGRRGGAGRRCRQPSGRQHLAERTAILGEVDRLRRGAHDRNPGVLQPLCEAERRLPAELHDQPRDNAGTLFRAHHVAEAFHLASTGRPGPVLIDVPKDVQQEVTSFSWPGQLRLPGYRPTTAPNGKQIREAARLICAAQRPVLYAGGGVIKAGASAGLREFAELTGIPVVTTLMARGAFPDSHHQHLGMPGMHGSVTAVAAMQRADLLIALGARFDDRVTGRLSSFAPDAKVVHADIDPAEISKNRHADVPIVGDCREVLAELVPAVASARQREPAADLAPWWRDLDGWRETFPLGYDPPPDGTLSPQYVIERIGALAGPDAVYVAGVGQHQMWAAQFIGYERPGAWINSGGLGTMGFAVPAAMGAKFGRPGREIWAIDGDGCFQMTGQELATCELEGAPIKVAILNNGSLGMVRQWQDLFYDGRYSHTDLGTHKRHVPDFKQMAESLGCVGLRCESPEDVDATIRAAMETDDHPVVIDFVVGMDAQVWPMVAAGAGNDEVMAARDIRPLSDRGEV